MGLLIVLIFSVKRDARSSAGSRMGLEVLEVEGAEKVLSTYKSGRVTE